jgi:uncharacterized protein (DUF924 family)
MPVSIDDVLNFWFVETLREEWFRKDPEFDRRVMERLGEAHGVAAKGDLDAWQDTARGCLGLLVLLDQVPRNIFRDTPRAFATDAAARAVASHAIECGFDQDSGFDDNLRLFLYTPFMHSEHLDDQNLCVRLISERIAAENRGGYAERHRDIIAKFGRFPHRNHILDRASSDEERAFLEEDGSSF